MDFARNSKQELVYADSSSHGIYFCEYCKEKVHLRRPENMKPHFYHFRYNSDCSLCEGTNDYQINKKSIDKSLKDLQTNYPRLWMEAIDNLIKYNCLYLLDGKTWAANPVNNYINKKIEILLKTPELFFRLLTVLLHINNKTSNNSLQDYLMFPMFNDIDKEYLIKELGNNIKNIASITDDFFKHIISKNTYNPHLIYPFIQKMSDEQMQIISRHEKYCMLPLIYRIINGRKKNISGIVIYNEIRERYKDIFTLEQWKMFFSVLKKNIDRRASPVYYKFIVDMETQVFTG
jgi:hypothetical protein